MKLKQSLLFLTLSLTSACQIRPASTVRVEPNNRTECEYHCKALGMELGAVVIMMSSVGCVCEPYEDDRTASRKGGASSAGAMTIVSVEEQQAASRNAAARSSSSSRTR
jgi:hypothetical protein